MGVTKYIRGSTLTALMAATGALPVLPIPVRAGQIEETKTGITTYSYHEKGGRIGVLAPTVWVQAPVVRDIDLEAYVTIDSISGASPQYVSNQSGRPVHALSSASIRESRREESIKATRWFGDNSVSLGANTSTEHDYVSHAFSADAKFDFLNKNVTWAAGTSVSSDSISATNNPSLHENRSTHSLFTGITQVLSPTDIIQSNLDYTYGQGYFDDPYKFTMTFSGTVPVVHTDQRPRTRNSTAWLTRWRHFVPAHNAALGLDYRYFRDSWGINAHMLEVSWHQPLSPTWSVRPLVRYYTQSAASFYSPTFAAASGVGSSDARLAAFGAGTVALNAIARLGEHDTIEFMAGRYAQRSSWRSGGGSAEIMKLDADIFKVSWTRLF